MRAVSVMLPVILAGPLAVAGPVQAGSPTCERVAPDLVQVDGLVDEWRGIAGVHIGGKDKDMSATLRCAYDDERLHVAVRVRDEYLHRSKSRRGSRNDHLVMKLAVGKARAHELRVYPGSDDHAPRRAWNREAVPGWVRVEDTQQRGGWSMELTIPLARIRGYGKGVPGVSARLEYRDADFAGKTEDKLRFRGSLMFQGSAELYRSFLQATGLTPGQVRMDELANVDDTPGPERIVAGGKILGVLSDRFAYLELPVRSFTDISKVQIADLRGDGTKSILTEFRQHGDSGSRDILAVWQVVGNGQFQRVLAVETRRALGDKVLANRWSLVPRGKYRKDARRSRRGKDLLIEVSDADVEGWDEDSYHEGPATDARPILTPWSDATSAVYGFEGNAVVGGDPKPSRRGR